MARDKPPELTPASTICFTNLEGFESLKCQGYTNLADSPEVSTAVNTIARLIGAMTIHLMENGESGDVRIRNAISDVVDISPNRYMTRANFIQWIVRTLFLYGRGNAVVFPVTERGVLRELVPIPAAYVSLVQQGLWGYTVAINGREYQPEDVLHFVLNPENFFPWRGAGYHVALADVANNLKQAAVTENGFMSSKWKPSLIIKLDALVDEMGNPISRNELLEEYIQTTEAGQPWLIPAEQMQVQEVKPLTLSDLALADFVKLDKQTVASILGVPPFVLGVGEFKREAWNSFISTTIMPLAQLIEQELTRKLITARDQYFHFNPRSLLNYSMEELIKAGSEMVEHMAMTRNEWRDWMGLEPRPDMDELLALENFIPADRLGDQNKLGGGDT